MLVPKHPLNLKITGNEVTKYTFGNTAIFYDKID